MTQHERWWNTHQHTSEVVPRPSSGCTHVCVLVGSRARYIIRWMTILHEHMDNLYTRTRGCTETCIRDMRLYSQANTAASKASVGIQCCNICSAVDNMRTCLCRLYITRICEQTLQPLWVISGPRFANSHFASHALRTPPTPP